MLHSLHGEAADPSSLNLSSGVTIAALSRDLSKRKNHCHQLPKTRNSSKSMHGKYITEKLIRLPELVSVEELRVDGTLWNVVKEPMT